MGKGTFLGEFEIYVMLALVHLRDDAYGVTIRQEIERRTGRDPAIGAVYATLSRLEEKGLVRHELSRPLPVQGGKARKYYSLTPSGERALTHAASMITRMMHGWRPRTEPRS
jgi:PadR family transcriptional regulator, regulatory protein PadR